MTCGGISRACHFCLSTGTAGEPTIGIHPEPFLSASGNGLKSRGFQQLFGIVTVLSQYRWVDSVLLSQLLNPRRRQGGEIPDTADFFLLKFLPNLPCDSCL